MKRKLLAVLMAVMVMFAVFPAAAYASGEASQEDKTNIIEQVKQQLSSAFESMDEETAGEVFSFLKEKVSEGNLSTESGIQTAIEEGEDKFGVEISKEDARKLVDTMEKLEDMGFSAEYVIDKTESLYQEYGNGFVDHVDEVVTGAVKNAASNAVSSFFTNLKNAVKSFFAKLFS
ncbi:MAG: DUF1002 domain-containing protein [Clostridium sp.]|nr:DUF1002 domain-containing protein [Clostridium sp.]